ncbi:hypothetical protein [Ilumatobacter sp.]|uniref:hypothetical protein n=1 Tax=Ilumatobacter sp. TaxID=1967498 RepID=UPI003C5BA60E
MGASALPYPPPFFRWFPAALGAACVLTLSACGSDEKGHDPPASATSIDDRAFRERIEDIQSAVTDWESAESIGEAQAAAETAANLVVGPGGPGYGDRDGDGTIGGDVDVGLLSGIDGAPVGVAVDLAANPCVTRDVLGATVDDPAAGWAEMNAAIDAWRPDDNTMPTLASHPMRVVGWSTFTLASDDLDEAHEYAGHAQLHVDVSREALDC